MRIAMRIPIRIAMRIPIRILIGNWIRIPAEFLELTAYLLSNTKQKAIVKSRSKQTKNVSSITFAILLHKYQYAPYDPQLLEQLQDLTSLAKIDRFEPRFESYINRWVIR